MILGAGFAQLPAIRKATALGLHVITVDYLPDNVGHRLSHQFVHCNTVDAQGVLRAARTLGIDGIMTFASDVATASVALVAQSLGLPGPLSAAAETMSDKARFRAFQREHDLPHPSFVVGVEWGEFEAWLKEAAQATEGPGGEPGDVVFKPVDSSGSRGVSVVSPLHTAACEAAFASARGHSRTGRVCAETFLGGVEVGGDGFLLDGRLAFAAVTCKHKRGCVVTGHSLPTDVPAEAAREVRSAVSRHCAALGYANGPVNFDVMVTDSGRVVALEMSPRQGGNGIPAVIERALGVDMTAATIAYALGERPDLSPRPGHPPQSCGSLVLGAERAGRLLSITPEAELRSILPQVFEVLYHCRVGDEVSAFEHGGHNLGHVLFDCGTGGYKQTAAAVHRALRLEVADRHEPANGRERHVG